MTKRRAVGIIGGTFDPIHFGHLVAAEEARARFSLDRVIFVPNGDPPHKKSYAVTPAERRYEMVELATASNPFFETSRIEIDRPGPSYSVDTVRAFREQFGAGSELYFITGVDALTEIATWHEPERLLELCELIAVTRPGYEAEQLRAALTPQMLARTHLLDIPRVDVSSTELRERAAAGQPLRYLTPEPVVRYIEARGLYR
ncbi:MAG: nicotinate-nucleotide adenylyltransferase [Armatimonadota bacterium]|jgi:nicotinate-nucleotide adenylyltransferase